MITCSPAWKHEFLCPCYNCRLALLLLLLLPIKRCFAAIGAKNTKNSSMATTPASSFVFIMAKDMRGRLIVDWSVGWLLCKKRKGSNTVVAEVVLGNENVRNDGDITATKGQKFNRKALRDSKLSFILIGSPKWIYLGLLSWEDKETCHHPTYLESKFFYRGNGCQLTYFSVWN